MKNFFLINLLIPILLYSQAKYNHNELKWNTFETLNFRIHYHDGLERTALEGSKVAESVYKTITSLYKYVPVEKTEIIFIDTDDYSNGIAYFYENKIEIWASPLDFNLRGSHNWLNNVITHEFTHIISMGASMKYKSRFPSSYFQVISYENEKRDDVLYGFPNVIMSYPIPGIAVPPWYAEGIAQFMFKNSTYDTWDSHRDMVLRDLVKNDKLLSIDEMNTFGKTGIGNELIYNTGYAFTHYLVYKFGEDILYLISKNLSQKNSYSIKKAIENSTNMKLDTIFSEYKNNLISRYSIINKDLNGKILQKNSNGNFYPKWHPHERKFAYLSNDGNDFLNQTNLMVYSFEDSSKKIISKNVYSGPSWNTQGDKIYFSKKSKPDKYGSRWFDIYFYDFTTKEENQLTKSSRGFSPLVLDGDSLLAYISTNDGTQNIYLINLENKQTKKITNFNDGKQITNLSYNSKNRLIMFDYTNNHFRNIGGISLTDTTFGDIFPFDLWDDRDISSNEMGDLIYSTDRSGIFNLYYSNNDGSKQGYISNVNGGAFMPDINSNGEILYSLYENEGYRIAYLDSIKLINEIDVGYNPNEFLKNENLFTSSVLEEENFIEPIKKKYQDSFTKIFISPKLLIDYGMFMPGFYFQSSEILNRLNISGSFSINRVSDLDLSLFFELNTLFPTLYSEVFFMTRHLNNKSKLWDIIDIDQNIKYRLFRIDNGIKIPIGSLISWNLYTSYQNYRTNQLWWIPGEKLFGKQGIDYFSGFHVGTNFKIKSFTPSFYYNINPNNGFNINFDLKYERNNFFSPEESLISNVFKKYNFLRTELSSSFFINIPYMKNWTLSNEFQLGYISSENIDSFFNFFAGGKPGIKGYPYYSIEGNKMAISSSSIRFPLASNINFKIASLTVQNIFLGFTYQAGDAWTINKNFNTKKSYGLDLRLGGFSFYNFPTALSVEVHKGLNSFENNQYVYGKDLRTYLSLLFGF